MIPSEVVVWEKMPVLGTGKTDHLEVNRRIREAAAATAERARLADHEKLSPVARRGSSFRGMKTCGPGLQPFSLAAISATWRPWKRAASSSFDEG